MAATGMFSVASGRGDDSSARTRSPHGTPTPVSAARNPPSTHHIRSFPWRSRVSTDSESGFDFRVSQKYVPTAPPTANARASHSQGCRPYRAAGREGRAIANTRTAISRARRNSSSQCRSCIRRAFDGWRDFNRRRAGNSIRFGLARMTMCRMTGTAASNSPISRLELINVMQNFSATAKTL